MYHSVYLIGEEQRLEILKAVLHHLEKQKHSEGVEDTHGTEYSITQFPKLRYITKLVEEICSVLYNKNLICRNYWVSVSRPGTTVVTHDHMDVEENCVSAVLYLNAPNDCGSLYLDQYTQFVTPVNGSLVCFPSYCKHSVTINNSDEERICLAFDLKLNI